MALIKNKSTDENRDFWTHVEAVAKEAPSIKGWSCSDNQPSQSPQEQRDPQNDGSQGE